jgi:aminoglycoside 6'-N-acetyltransferase I
MRAEPCNHEGLAEWVRLRHALWPHLSEQRHRVEASSILERADRACSFLVRDAGMAAIGFAEATLRQDYVNGCTTSPVAFIEGIFVVPDWRRRGAARCLCDAIEEWAASLGCSELASDTDLGNRGSQRMHGALGFEETERVIFYRKLLS